MMMMKYSDEERSDKYLDEDCLDEYPENESNNSAGGGRTLFLAVNLLRTPRGKPAGADKKGETPSATSAWSDDGGSSDGSDSISEWLIKSSTPVERELAISKESVSETWVSVEAIDLHISKEVATTKQAFYYRVLQEIWVLDYRFRQIPLFKCDWVNHRAGGVKRDNLGYTLVDLNNLGHKVDPFILASQARQVFYVKDQIDKKLSIIFKTPPKNYKDTYDEVDEEFSTVIHQRNDNILPCVNRRDLGNESQNDYYRTDCEEPI
ncbi:hypothetical protein Tco_0917222 [Tanacetum coccineum]